MTKAHLRIALAVIVVGGLLVAVIVGRDSPTHRVLTVALHGHGCAEAPTRITSLSTPPKAYFTWDRKNDTAWRVEGCGAAFDAVVHEHREPTGRKNKHHRDVFEVVFWQPATPSLKTSAGGEDQADRDDRDAHQALAGDQARGH